MSDVLYPLGNIESLDVTLHDRTINDAFEDGSSSARRLWPDKNFKRRFVLKHTALSTSEFRYLRSFFAARSGRYDYFWFRDNVHRSGNAKVRLAEPFRIVKSGSNVYTPQVTLDEVAPIRLLVDQDDFASLTAGSPFLWYDFNRTRIYLHASLPYGESSIGSEAASTSYFNGGTLVINGSTYLALAGWQDSQYQGYSGGQYLKSSSSDATVLGSPLSIFCIARNLSVASRRVLFSLGEMGAGKALGLALNASNQYEPFLGGSETWINAKYSNASTAWRSFAIVKELGGLFSLYVNGALVGQDSQTFNGSSAAFLTIGAAPDGTLGVSFNASNGVNHCMAYNLRFTLAHVKELHNLFAYQYGLATV